MHRERRSVCVAKMTYNSDGTIQKLPWWNDGGVSQIGALNPFARIEAATICYEMGVKTKPRGGGQTGVFVNITENGSYIKIKGVDFGAKGTADSSGFGDGVAPPVSTAEITIPLREPACRWRFRPFRRLALSWMPCFFPACWPKVLAAGSARSAGLISEPVAYRCRIGHTVEKVCCWNQDLNVSTVVRLAARSSS